MSTIEQVCELVTPRITEVELDDLRRPQDDEVLFAHGASLADFTSDEFDSLPILRKYQTFYNREVTAWHWDVMASTIHVTEYGSCTAKFVGIARTALRWLDRHTLLAMGDELEEHALRVEDVSSGDVLVFNGFSSDVVMIHQVETTQMPRRSHGFPIIRY